MLEEEIFYKKRLFFEIDVIRKRNKRNGGMAVPFIDE